MSTFEFFNIETNKEGHVEYLWQCHVCGSIQMNAASDEPPDECEYCSNHEGEK